MKTSKILTALVLPAMLAACTAEDIEMGNNNIAQSERPLLNEDFRLISEGDGVSSRFYMAGSTTLTTVWEDGDKYGAALIDEYRPNVKPESWKIIPSLAGNTPFIYDAAADEWKAVAATGVGHYLFSFPYNIDDQNRAAVSWELPAIQELYSDVDGEVELNAVVDNYNKSVAAALLKENATAHSVKMRNLFSYPKFVVKFDNGLPISTVSQVVLELANGDDFAVKGGFNHQAVWNMFNPENIAYDVNVAKEYADVDEYWASKQTTDFIIDNDETQDGYGKLSQYTEEKSSKYIVAKFPNNHKVQLDNDNNKCVEVRFMIPGDLLSNGGLYTKNQNLKMHIYTNNGVYTIANVATAIDFKTTTPEETRNRVFARNASYTLNLKKDAPVPGEELYIVTDVEDWNDLVAKYGSSKAYTGAKALNIAVVGEEFALDETADMPTKAQFKLTTTVKINGEVTLNNILFPWDGTEDTKLIVNEGATLNIADNSNSLGNIKNYGIVNIKKYVKSGVVAEINTIVYLDVMPGAILSIEEDAEVSVRLNNKISDYDNDLTHGEVVNNGVLTLNSHDNSGVITNNGVVKVEGGFTTHASKYVYDVDGEIIDKFTPSFVNNGTFVADGAEYVNYGEFINAATGNVSCAGGASGQFTNNGYIKATKEGTLLITNNENGVIELDEINQTKWNVEAKKYGTILYVAKAADASLDFSSSEVTKLVVGNQNMTITKTNKLNNVEMGKGTLTLPKYDATAKNATTGINNTELAGNLTLTGDVVIASESAKITGLLTVKKDASLTIAKNNHVYAGTTDNAGAVLVAGTFETGSEESKAGTGIFKSTQGSTGNIKFYDKDAADKAEKLAEAKEDFEDALAEALAEWVTLSTTNDFKLDFDRFYLNLNDSTTKVEYAGTTTYGAAKTFVRWIEYSSSTEPKSLAAKNAFETYYALDNTVKIVDSYATAVSAYVEELKKTDNYKKDMEGFTTIPVALGMTDFFVDNDNYKCTDGSIWTKTAEEYALENFQTHVYLSGLKKETKLVLNAAESYEAIEKYVPDYTFAFVEDNIYKLYKNYIVEYGFAGPADNKLASVQAWVKAIADWTSKDLESKTANEKILHKFITENDYKVYLESRNWNYSEKTIEAIKTKASSK